MKKLNILFLVVLLLLTACGKQVSKDITPAGEKDAIVENQVATPDVATSLPEIEIVEEKVYPSFKKMLGDISNSYTKDNELNRCVAESVDSCLSTTISQANDLEVCDDYILEDNRATCRDNYYISQASTSGNSSLCENVGNPSACLAEVIVGKGIDSGDLSVCNDYADENEKLNCNNTIAFALAEKDNDTAWCDRIQSQADSEGLIDDSAQQMCRDALTEVEDEGGNEVPLPPVTPPDTSLPPE